MLRNQQRGLPLYHGFPWNRQADRELTRLARRMRAHGRTADDAIRALARLFQRTRVAIYLRLHALGLVVGPFND